MTKKELQTLKQEYRNAIFDSCYYFHKMSMARTKDSKIGYDLVKHTELVIERILDVLKINPEELLSENERNYIQKIAMETATKYNFKGEFFHPLFYCVELCLYKYLLFIYV